MLRHVAQVVDEHTILGDVLSRTAAAEFMVLLPDTTADDAEALAKRLRLQVCLEPLQFAGGATSVTLGIGIGIGIGIAVLTACDSNAEAALARADRSLRGEGSGP